MAEEGRYPLLVFPEATVVPSVLSPPRGGGARNPKKARQIERLDAQFLVLQEVLEQRRAAVSAAAVATAPEHVLAFETSGPAKALLEAIAETPELEWLVSHEERVDQDEDFHLESSTRQLVACVYIVMFNQRALEQLLSVWKTYKTSKRMPRGFKCWTSVFRCLRAIRRWGPEDRLREAGLLRDLLEPIEAQGLMPVEIELWARSDERRSIAEANIRRLVEKAQGAVLDAAVLPEIRYHALLVELRRDYLQRLLDAKDVELLQADDIYLLRPTPQCSVDLDVSAGREAPTPKMARVGGSPVCALLDGLPMENHPHLGGRLVVDDPDDWAVRYPVADRKHGTAMASLVMHGDLADKGVALERPLYVRPILRPYRSREAAPRSRLWLDLVHEAVRRILATDGPAPPVAPGVRIINLSVGDEGRPFLHEPSPLARLLDWLAFKHHVLFVVSAGNHDTELPEECRDDEMALRFVYRGSRQRRLLSPAETINGITVGALNSDGAEPDLRGNLRVIPNRQDLPAAYSALGRGFRRAPKPDVLTPGGRRVFRPRVPMGGAPWVPVGNEPVGQLVAVPGHAGSNQVTHVAGTSNAAALTSRAAVVVLETLEELVARAAADALRSVPMAVLVKALLVHTATWPEEASSFACRVLEDTLTPERSRDELSALLGYGVLRPSRATECAQTRATVVGGGWIEKDQTLVHRLPLPGCLHLHREWRRVTATLAWLTPINPQDRRYRVARVRMTVPRTSELLVEGVQVHGSAAVRGTLQHVVLETDEAVINMEPGAWLEIRVTCTEDAGGAGSSDPLRHRGVARGRGEDWARGLSGDFFAVACASGGSGSRCPGTVKRMICASAEACQRGSCHPAKHAASSPSCPHRT